MIKEVTIKILRLNTGEDIIGSCLDDEEHNSIEIENPMRVFLRRFDSSRSQNRTMLLMSPWLPLELIEEDYASINYADILTVINPSKKFIEYYTSTVSEFKERIEGITEEELIDESHESLEEDEYDFGPLTNVKKDILH